jgi:uncharacterized protein (DUF58 family)
VVFDFNGQAVMNINVTTSLWDRVKHWSRIGFFQNPREFRTYSVTLIGFVVLLLIFVIGFAAWESGTNLVYFLFGFLIAIFVAHGVVSPQNIRGLHVERILPRRIIAGHPARIHFRIWKSNWWRSFALMVKDHTPQGKAVGGTFCEVVNPGAPRSVAYETVHPIFQRRGLVALDKITISSRFPFGTVERTVHFHRPAEVLVYPPIYAFDDSLKDSFSTLGQESRSQRGQGIDIYGLREYVQGEPMRRIHWRSSAKAQRLMVMEFEREERRAVLLVLPNSLPQGVTRSEELTNLFEIAVAFTASLAYYFLEHRHPVGLLTSRGFIPCAEEEGQLDRILQALALIELDLSGYSIRLPAVEADVVVIQFIDTLFAWPPGTTTLDVRDWEIRLVEEDRCPRADGETVALPLIASKQFCKVRGVGR